jgi:hypothetical protein
MIGKPHDAVGVGDIDPLRVVAARKEGDAEGMAETACKCLVGTGFRSAIGGPQNADAAGTGFGDKNIAVRRDADDARTSQALREQLNLEPGRRLRLGAGGPCHDTCGVRG